MGLGLNGYVLAGGRSTRMGRDKAKLPLGGRPLIAHAVQKLESICEDVYILSDDPELASFAHLVPDQHPGCGPVAGLEAALMHTDKPWNLFIPVDVPFLPAALLDVWSKEALSRTAQGARLAAFSVGGELQPAVLLLHRGTAGGVATCAAQGRLKLAMALEWTASELATARGVPRDQVFWRTDLPLYKSGEHPRWLEERMPEFRDDDRASRWWFANLNTPEELSEAEEYLKSLKC